MHFPIHSDRQSTAENEAGSSVGSMFDHTTVESTAMVSFGTGNVHRFPSADSDEDTCGTAGVIKGIMIPFQHL